MSAGLPGLGLGGLFFIFSALLAPFGELWRTFRGRSRPGEWRIVGRQFAQAVTMVVSIDLTLRLTYVGLSLAGAGDVPSAVSGTVLPLTLIGITSALLVAVLVAAKLAQLGFRLRSAELPTIPDAMPRPAPLRALTFGGAAAIAWVALLSIGASELTPLATPPDAGPSSTGDRDPAGLSSSDAVVRPHSDGSFAVAPVEGPDLAREGTDAGHHGRGSGADGGAQPPAPATPTVSVSVPTPGAQSHGGGPAGGKPPRPEGSASQPSAGGKATSTHSPPASAGPPEGSPAPEHAGPSPEAPPAPEPKGPPAGSPAPAHGGQGSGP
jgi:hypothetical protein